MARKTTEVQKSAPLVDSADDPAPAPKAVAPNTVEVAYYQGGKRTVLFVGTATGGVTFTLDVNEIDFSATATAGATNVLGGVDAEIPEAAGGRVEVRYQGQLACYLPCDHLNSWYAGGKVYGAALVTKYIGGNRAASKAPAQAPAPPQTTPATAITFTTSAVSATGCTLHWTSVPTATGYAIYSRSAHTTQPYHKLADVAPNGTSDEDYVATGLNGSLEFIVFAVTPTTTIVAPADDDAGTVVALA